MAMGSYPVPDFQKRVWQPRSLMEAWQLKQSLKEQAVIVSGGTLLRTQWESGTAWMPPHLISLEAIPELLRFSCTDSEVSIGAGVTLADCQLRTDTPQLLKEACRNIAAPSIRRMGTLGGNVMSAVGDSIPALVASGAQLVWFDGKTADVQSVEAWIMQRKTAGAAKEQRILTEICWDREAAGTSKVYEFYEKVGRREGFCPSVVTVAGKVQADNVGKIHDVRLAAGSAAAMTVRLTEAELLLEGASWSSRLAESVHQAVMNQFDGGTDAFASEAYRKRTAANLIVALLWSRLTKSMESGM
jgi:xanthine dehydrogenase C subunit